MDVLERTALAGYLTPVSSCRWAGCGIQLDDKMRVELKQ
jgi:hypothetical protein